MYYASSANPNYQKVKKFSQEESQEKCYSLGYVIRKVITCIHYYNTWSV